MKVNQITRQLIAKGRHGINEAMVERWIKQDLQDYVKKRNGRWVLRSEHDRSEDETGRGEHGDENSDRNENDVSEEAIRCNEAGEWQLADAESLRREEASTETSGSDAPSDSDALKERVLQTLAGAFEALGSTELAKRLNEEGIDTDGGTVVEHLYQLRKEKRVLVDEHYQWHAAQGERAATGPSPPAEMPSVDTKIEAANAAREPVSSKDASPKERVLHTLARATGPLREEALMRRLREEGHKIEQEAVVEHLCRLREEERVLVDRRLGWHAMPDVRADTSPSKPKENASEPAADVSPPVAFAPSGAAGSVTDDLERAGQLALMLDLAPHPLTTDKLSDLLQQAGKPVSIEEVERLLTGPLHDYAQRDGKRGWILHADESEAPTGNTLGKRPDDYLLAAHTRADGVEYEFVGADLDSPAFFAAEMKGAATVQVKLNDQHPAYGLLETALEVGTQKKDARTLRRLLRKAQRGLQLLLAGWMRHEHNLNGARGQRTRKERSDWGRSVRRIVRRHEQSEQL
jgi:hypothetical protein